MKIKIERHNEECYYADCLDLPGTPPIGVGETPEMAVAALFYLMLFDSTLGPDGNKGGWIKYIKQGEDIVINSVVWKHPPIPLKGADRSDD